MAYQGQRGLNPVGLGVAIAINGGLLAVAVLTATTVVTRIDPWKPIEAVNVPIEPPPPPVDMPKPVEKALPDPAPREQATSVAAARDEARRPRGEAWRRDQAEVADDGGWNGPVPDFLKVALTA